MINIIDHIWQVELKQFPILPTVIKFANNQPKSYFYSQKQHRVLRKKEQGVPTALEFLGKSIHSYRNYLLIKKKALNQVEFSLILKCQAEEMLNNQAVNCSIIQLQQCQASTLILDCSFDAHSNFSTLPLMIYSKQKSFWSPDIGNVEIFSNILAKYMLNLWIALPTLLKAKSKCRKIQLILSTSPKFDIINVLWCNELSFDAQEFYQIRYNYRIKSFELQQTQEKAKAETIRPIQKIEVKHNFIKKQPQQKVKQSVEDNTREQGKIICNGCERSCLEQACKEAQNSDVVSIRRRKKLSIVGIKDEYLQICEECYYSIDE